MAPGACFDGALGEFILQYDTIRDAAEPDALLLDFQLQPTQPRWRLASGTAWRWNLPLLFLGSASAVMLRHPRAPMLEAAQSVGAMRVASRAAYADIPYTSFSITRTLGLGQS